MISAGLYIILSLLHRLSQVSTTQRICAATQSPKLFQWWTL